MKRLAGIALWVASACTLPFDPAKLIDGAVGNGGDAGPPPCSSQRALELPQIAELSIASTGPPYGLALVWSTWDGAGPISEASFVELDPSGVRIGPVTTVVTAPLGIDLSSAGLAWIGDGFGLLWMEGSSLYGALRLTRLDSAGAPIDDPILVPGAAEACCGELVWVAGALSALWLRHQTGSFELQATRFGAGGPVTSGSGVWRSELSARAGGPAIGAAMIGETDSTRVLFRRVDPAGGLLGTEVDLMAGGEQPGGVRLARSDAGWAVAWIEGSFFGEPGRQVHLLALDDAGAPLGPHSMVSEGPQNVSVARLAWVAGRYVVAWTDTRHGNEEIYARAFDAQGAPVAGEVRVTDTPGSSWVHDVLPIGDRIGVAWVEDQEAYLTFLCPEPPLFD